MFTRPLCALIVVSLGLSATSVPLRAECLHEFAASVARDFKRRNCWPKPFVCPDRQTVRAPFHMMVNNGWRRQNMLGDHHFQPTTGEITEAAEMKIRWILTAAPQHHRTIYVHRADFPAETTARMESVRLATRNILPEGMEAAILETDVPSYGWPAWQVDAIDRMFESSMPEPRLPAAQASEGD